MSYKLISLFALSETRTTKDYVLAIIHTLKVVENIESAKLKLIEQAYLIELKI